MPPVKCPSCGSPAPSLHPKGNRFEARMSPEDGACLDRFHDTRKREKGTPVYYLMVPLTHLNPPEEQVGGQKEFDRKVQSLLLDIVNGLIPSWVTRYQDVRDLSSVVKKGGTKEVEVGVFRVTEHVERTEEPKENER